MKLTKHKCTVKEVRIQKVIISNKEARPKAFLQVFTKFSLDLDRLQLKGNLPKDIASALADNMSDAIGEDDDRPRWAGASYKNAIGSLDVKLEGTFASVGLSCVSKGNMKALPVEDDCNVINISFNLISIIDRAEIGDLALCLLEGTRITCAPMPDAQQALDFSSEKAKDTVAALAAKGKTDAKKNGKAKKAIDDLVAKGKKAAKKRGKRAPATATA